MENNKITALVELGILCRGEDVPVHGDGGLDIGPHAYSGHHQFARYENPLYQYPFEDGQKAAYAIYPPDLTLPDALEMSQVVVLLGAAESQEMIASLDRPDTIVLVFEPDDRALVAFLEQANLRRLNRGGVFIFTGNPYSFNPALQEMLPSDIFELGTPAFFMTERIRSLYPEWAAQVTEYLEILHYRHVLYPNSGQFRARSKPMRDIRRDIIFDQQVHAYENVGDYLTAPDISHLRNRFVGHSAILVAASPDLSEKLDYIRANRKRAIVICVNNALKPLVEAGIKPHFTVINDVSIAAGEVFRHIPPVPETILVAHCLSDLGGDRFKQKFLCFDYMPNVFGHREELELHGSVISTAFSLARFMGCTRCVIVGGQLGSRSPWGLGYAKGTVKDALSEEEKPLIHRHPQLYPVATPFGETLYTTPNFRDAALWLTEVMRLSDVECINTSRASTLHGQGIRYEAEPALPDASFAKAFADLFRIRGNPPDFGAVNQYLQLELDRWKSIKTVSEQLMGARGGQLVELGMPILHEMDRNNVTYLVERYKTFNNKDFVTWFNDPAPGSRPKALRYYFKRVLQMSKDLLLLLAQARRTCRELEQRSS